MEPREYRLKNGALLLVRDAQLADAANVLAYNEDTSRESDNLSFGPGEHGITLSQEEDIIRSSQSADNALFIVGVIENEIISLLNFSGGRRPRMRHRGEFGISVRKAYWNLGIAGLMLDTMIDWARGSGVVTKINLRVRTDNQPAIALYEKKGFIREGTLRKDMFIDGEYFDLNYMGLEV